MTQAGTRGSIALTTQSHTKYFAQSSGNCSKRKCFQQSPSGETVGSQTWLFLRSDVGTQHGIQCVMQLLGSRGYLAMMCGPPFTGKYLPGTITGPEDFDYFHELILYDEIGRCGDGMSWVCCATDVRVSGSCQCTDKRLGNWSSCCTSIRI